MPNIHVEVNPDDISDYEYPEGTQYDNVNTNTDVNKQFSNALFNDSCNSDPDDGVWELPKLKIPEKGKAVSDTLAKLINVSCTQQCDIDSLLAKYKIPENCEMVNPPLVNQEIWKILDKKAHGQDKILVDIQNLAAIGFAPIIRLAEVFKGQISCNSEVKSLLSDALTVLGQIQYNLSVQRRYMIRPALKRKYAALCHMSMPITTKLFGDDISKEVKNCESFAYLCRDSVRGTGFVRSSNRSRFPRRSYGGSYGYQAHPSRYQPYPQRGQQYRPYSARSRPARKAPVATVTAPNGQE
ncbi:uncharacterized protein LOC123549154 [Mercenaria mercenaria]|uniref:uncharacterized protein LOC123549154 n=1 Tax=Mercenaria mercenaria TaxID=6596 RepID=UPI00234F7FE7|nr:uncharacterized protein LOC123549154 [Mercenaria mercenaria]XP_053402374.1 uncharacterized protein LOC123549154 [Mercenaria mercenaria]